MFNKLSDSKEKTLKCQKLQKIRQKLLSSKSALAVLFLSIGSLSTLIFQHFYHKDQLHSYAEIGLDAFSKNNDFERIFSDKNGFKSLFETNEAIFNEIINEQKRFYENFSRIEQEISKRQQEFHQSISTPILDEEVSNSDKSLSIQGKSTLNLDSNFVVKSENTPTYLAYELNFSGFKPEEMTVETKKNSLIFSAKKSENNSEIIQKNDEEKKAKKDDLQQPNEEIKASKQKAQKLISESSFYYEISLPKVKFKGEPEIIRKANRIIVKLNK